MSFLTNHPISRKWPPQHPDRLQLYSLTTPNGVKASIMLEETGLAYEAHYVSFETDDQKSDEFRALNPYGKIPAMIDPDGPGGEALALWESGAILSYLAEKSGQFLPEEVARRWETLQWVFFQVAGVGPIFGQLGYFHRFDGREIEDKRPRDRYVSESQRLLQVIEDRLADREWMMGDTYTIADIAIFPLVRNLIRFYEAGKLVGIDDYPQVQRALAAFVKRPAVVRGLEIPAPPAS